MSKQQIRVIDYKGEQKTLRQWANSLGMKYQTLYDRIEKVDAGLTSLDEAMLAPVRNNAEHGNIAPGKPAPVGAGRKVEVGRVRTVTALIDAFNKHAIDTGKLEQDVKEYLDEHGSIKFLQEMKDYYRGAIEAADNESRPVASVGVFIAGNPNPEDIVILDV